MACAQKEDKQTRSNLGKPLDPATQTLQQQYAQQGLELVVQSIDKTPVSGATQFDTKVSVGNVSQTARFIHQDYYSGTYSDTTPVGPLQVTATSQYFQEYDTYFIMLDAKQNGRTLYQIGLLKNFRSGDAWYKIVSGDSPVTFDQMLSYF